MTRETVSAAIAEARRFIQRAQAMIDDGDEYAKQRIEEIRQAGGSIGKYPHAYWGPGPKPSGATRRASLDLTRALAEMRRPG